MADPLKPTIFERTRLGWEFYLLAAFLVSVIVVAIHFYTKSNAEEPEIETAEVITFGFQPTEVGMIKLMKIRMSDGVVRDIRITTRVAQSCRTGEKVKIHKRGLNVQVAPEACSPAKQN